MTAHSTSTSVSVFDDVIGQDDAVGRLRALATSPAHAYLFVGPAGCGKEKAARAFAALRLQGSEDGATRLADLVRRGIHVDVHEVEREGASIDIEQAREEIVKLADRTAVEGSTRAIIAHEFHLLADDARSTLMKTIEEPDGRTLIVLLADEIPESFATIQSRCVRVNFGPIPDRVVVERLVAEGTDPERAERLAHIVAGDLDRARILTTDTQLVARMETFAGIPTRLDGALATVIEVVGELLQAIESSLDPYKQRQEDEVDALEERVKLLGERGSGRKALTDRHKRELRRYRTDEMRSGLRALSLVYRDAIADLGASAPPHEVIAFSEAVSAIRSAADRLGRNVNERLLLESLLMKLPSVRKN